MPLFRSATGAVAAMPQRQPSSARLPRGAGCVVAGIVQRSHSARAYLAGATLACAAKTTMVACTADAAIDAAYNTPMSQSYSSEVVPLICARCATPVTPGQGDAYLVRIEALADPTPPSFTEEDLHRDAHREVARLIEQMRHLSEQELIDQVYRRMIFWLCGPCFRCWIKAPVG